VQSITVSSTAVQGVLPRPSFNPAGAVTGIGSLPLKSVSAAIQSIVEFSPEIPFWPQLPQLSEREIAIGQELNFISAYIEPRGTGYGYQVKEGLIDSVVEALHSSNGELTQANAAGFFAFETALSSDLFGQPLAVKGQTEGPMTLSAYLFHKGRPFLSDPALFSSVAFHVSQLICWQFERLSSAGVPVILFVDEPALYLEETGVSEDQRLSALSAILDDARTREAYAGLHCCAARPFERMFRVKPDILSFDAHEGLESFFAHPHAIDFVNQGGIVAYGLIPTKAISRCNGCGTDIHPLAGSGLPQWGSAEACATSNDHSNLRTRAARSHFCPRVLQRRPRCPQTGAESCRRTGRVF
jgi:hypothetical protein